MKNHQKKTCAVILFLFFLFIGFFYFQTDRLFALEIQQYPKISGQTLTADSKLPDYVLYLFNAGMTIGFWAVFASLVFAGAMYFLSSVNPDSLAEAKDRFAGAISGLLILLLTYLIVTTINPQLSFFATHSIPPAEVPPVEVKKAPGVYFYGRGISTDKVLPHTISASDLGLVKDKVTSVVIQPDEDNEIYYVVVVYDNINFWGKCLVLDSNARSGQSVPFAASASIHPYSFEPNGGGVSFYRKSYFNAAGGYFEVKNEAVGSVYAEKLEDLTFTDRGECTVPEEERDCIKYDKFGQCIERKCPTLAGENISSIKINGDYLVMLVYIGPDETASTSWASCQEFPIISDENKTGPPQIKWREVRNRGGVVPNHVIIIPIKDPY